MIDIYYDDFSTQYGNSTVSDEKTQTTEVDQETEVDEDEDFYMQGQSGPENYEGQSIQEKESDEFP